MTMRALAIVHQRDAGPGRIRRCDPLRGRRARHVAARRRRTRRPGDPADYDAVLVFGGAMHVDQEEQPSVAARGEGAAARAARAAACRCSASASGRSCWPRQRARRARRASRPEIGWHEVEVTAEGQRRPAARAARAALRGVPVAQLRVPAAARRDAARAQRRLPPGLPGRATRLGHPVPRRGDAARTRRPGSTTTAATRTPSGSVLDPDDAAAADPRSIGEWNALGRALCERFLRRRYSGVT